MIIVHNMLTRYGRSVNSACSVLVTMGQCCFDRLLLLLLMLLFAEPKEIWNKVKINISRD